MENTIAAFDAACAQGFRVLETDLRLTADGQVVLHHDPTLIRLFGDQRSVAATHRADLPATICSLVDFMRRYAHCEWVLDIKPETATGVISVLAVLGKDAAYRDALTRTTRFVTWSARHERQLRSVFPLARYYARDKECWRAGLAAIVRVPALGGVVADKIYSLPPRLGKQELYVERIVASYKQRSARVVAFLPESDADARRALAVGCDEILTNGTIVK